MNQASPATDRQLLVEVIDKNFQANVEEDSEYNAVLKQEKSNGQKLISDQELDGMKIGDNQFLSNNSSGLQGSQSQEQEPHYVDHNSIPKKHAHDNSDDEEEQSDDDRYNMAADSLPKQSQKDRLVEQNIKLKVQIYELAKQLDEIIEKDRRKKKTGLNVIEEDDEIIREKKLELKKQQIEIMDVKSKIFVVKRQLESVYNNLAVTEKENSLKNLQATLKALQKEREGLLNINREQVKALKVAQNEEEYGQKIDKVHSQYQVIKSETRKAVAQIVETEKTLKKTHGTYISRLQQLKQIESKLSLNKQKSKLRQKNQQIITDEMLKTLEKEVKEAQILKKEGERTWQQKIRLIDLELYKKKIEEERKMLILREKEKELKLNELRIRQLRKMVRDNEQAERELKNKDVDMSQYRHKRNIRYLDK